MAAADEGADELILHAAVLSQMTGELAGIYYPLGGMTKEQEDKLQVGPCEERAAAAAVWCCTGRCGSCDHRLECVEEGQSPFGLHPVVRLVTAKWPLSPHPKQGDWLPFKGTACKWLGPRDSPRPPSSPLPWRCTHPGIKLCRRTASCSRSQPPTTFWPTAALPATGPTRAASSTTRTRRSWCGSTRRTTCAASLCR